MAVTENSFTGNGSTTNYAFTFPYLKSTDIQVQLNATVTTNWSLANATTIQFTAPSGGATTTQESGGAPKTGVAIKILRKTNVDNLAATFYAGSSIKSEDLNDNYTQNLYVTQEIGNRSFENTGLSTMIGDLQMGEDTNVVFEGATDNDYETTLTVADPTADRTITIPNVTGTVVTTGDTGTVTSTMIADSTIASGDIADNAVIRAKIVADAVDGTKIADDAIDSEHIAADSIDTEHYAPNSVDTTALAADAVTGAQIADDAVDSEHLAADSIDAEHYAPGSVDATALASNAVTAVKINADAIDGTKIADDAINSEHITDGSIDHVHLAADIIDGDNIQDDVINSEHIAAGAVDLEHMSADSVDSDQYVDGSIDRVHLEADIIDSTKLADNAVGTEHIADAELTTLAGMQSGTASILAGGTALTSTLSELNLLDGKSIVTTISSPTDVQIPTAQAVDERIIDLVTDVGGFRPIANETSFPTTNPDPEDNAGTIVSVKALASNLTSNGSGVATIANGAGSGNTVTITGMANSDTIEAGKGILVETTSTLHTYTFHRETLAPADITAANTAVSDFNNRYRILASGTNINTVGSLDDGDLLWDSNVDKMKVYDATASEWKEVTSTGEFKYLFLCPTGGTGAPTYGGASYDLREASNSGSVASVTTAAQLLVSVNGVIQKANTGTSAPAEGFAMVDGNSIIFGSNIASTDSVFIVQVGSAVSIPTPGDDTVSTVKIQNLAVNTAKLAADAVDGTKLADNACDSEHYTDGSIDHEHLAGDCIDGDNIQDDVINSEHIAAGAVDLEHMSSESVDEDNLYISNAGSNGQFLQKQSGNDGGMTWADASSVGGATGVDFNDNVKSRWGTGNDLAVYHNNGTSYIDATGAGNTNAFSFNTAANLDIRVNSNEQAIYATANGGVGLYHDNSEKLVTTSTGATVTGNVKSGGVTLQTKWDSDVTYATSRSGGAGFGDTNLGPVSITPKFSTSKLQIQAGIQYRLDDGGSNNNWGALAVFRSNDGGSNWSQVTFGPRDSNGVFLLGINAGHQVRGYYQINFNTDASQTTEVQFKLMMNKFQDGSIVVNETSNDVQRCWMSVREYTD